MKLYFSPMACSMATRIALDEAGVDAELVEVDPKTKRTSDGADFRDVSPLGLVPVLATEGELLTENGAILQFIARRYPDAGLAPTDPRGLAELQRWLSFIATELHKAVFVPLLDPRAPEGAKAYALEKAAARLAVVERHLTGREYVLDRFSVADAYLVTVLGWCVATPILLRDWPALSAYVGRLAQRPSVARAISVELPLYRAEVARHASEAQAQAAS